MENIKELINPFIRKAKNWPDMLINGSKGGLSEEQVKIVLDKMQGFSKCFVEIGSGSGQFLLTHAKNNPENLYIGFEIRYKRSVRTIEKGLKDNINNILIIRSDANKFKEIFKDNSLSGVYINFPDPWEKLKWHKNRIIRSDILNTICDLLVDKGFLSFKTDHQEYFEWSESLIRKHKRLEVTEISRDLHNSPYDEGNVKTEFEQLFMSQKKPTNYLLAINS